MDLQFTVLRCPDAVAPETRSVPGGEFAVGRGPGVDWILPDPDRVLSKRHFMVAYRGGGWQIADTSTNGTFLNRENDPIGQGSIRPLRDGDRLRLGSYEIEVRLVEAARGMGSVQGGASPFGFDDPFAAPAAPPPPFNDPRPVALGPESLAQLPADFDPLAPDGPNGFSGPTQSDHAPVLNDAFLPRPAAPALPDNWDEDLLAGIGAPAPASPGGAVGGFGAACAEEPAGDPFGGNRGAPVPAAPGLPPSGPASGFPPAATAAPPFVPGFAAPGFTPAPPADPPHGALGEPAGFAPSPVAVPFSSPSPAPPAAPPVGALPWPAVAPAAAPVAAPAWPHAPEAEVSPFAEPSDPPPAYASPVAPPVAFAPQAAPPQPGPPQPAAAVSAAPSVAVPMGQPQAGTSPGTDDGALLAALLRGVGLPDAQPGDPAAMMLALGQAFRALVSGLRAVLIARASIKSEFRIEQTMIRARGNNPLKFSAGDEDALAALLGTGRRSDMSPAEAVADALRDIRLHELASMSAMQSAVRALLEGLDPAKLRAGAEQGGGLSVLPAQRKARAWDAYEALYGRTVQALSDDFDSLFGKAFARAYERALAETAGKEPH